jgi:aryl-alcohol dehydrogenase-like predicted oxidoreductase
MASLERFALAPDLTICRILNGMWQVSGAHGRIEREKALGSMAAHVDAGFTTWDLADHYGPAEDFVAIRLDAEDQARIEAVLVKSRDLLSVIGDCGDEYR